MIYKITESCTGCGRCVNACNFGAIVATSDGKYEITGSKCSGCGACVNFCPRGSIVPAETKGETITMGKGCMQNFRVRRHGGGGGGGGGYGGSGRGSRNCQ